MQGTIAVMPRFGFNLTDWFTNNADAVDRDLKRYFGGGKDKFTGRWFEDFAAIGDPNRFEPSDALAVEACGTRTTSASSGARCENPSVYRTCRRIPSARRWPR
jgi:hypothetical protein